MTSDPDDIERAALQLIDLAMAAPTDARIEFIRQSQDVDEAVRIRAADILRASDNGGADIRTADGLASDLFEEERDQIGPYRVIRTLGRGGMGAVYLCRKPADDFEHLVAVKLVHEADENSRLIERLHAERRMLPKLKHPHIAQFYDGGEDEDGRPYFVMEYVDGMPLDAFISSKDVSLEQRLTLFNDLCGAVSYAHGYLIVHRDITPSNVLVSTDGFAKLIDFGISSDITEPPMNVDPERGFRTGTRGYMAPERLRGEVATVSSDVYSLGVLLAQIIDADHVPRSMDLRAIIDKAKAEHPHEAGEGARAAARKQASAAPVRLAWPA